MAYLGWVSYLFVILICTRFISHLGLRCVAISLEKQIIHKSFHAGLIISTCNWQLISRLHMLLLFGHRIIGCSIKLPDHLANHKKAVVKQLKLHFSFRKLNASGSSFRCVFI